ncbi:rho guanine nucleotide exchange factor 26-like isoform X2 [Uloborus diversus]|nr:rho guanine nucleotide exchange factor 26-like isoform X2 [Uloborus diversus]
MQNCTRPQFTNYIRNSLSRRSDGSLSAQNTVYDLDQTIVKCQSLDLSRCQSIEHLYESIADIEAQEVENNTKDTSLHSNGSSTLSLKSEQNVDNDVDSGEWSTESASPTFDESNSKEVQDKKAETVSNQHRFSVHLECQETAKKTFMKSVLGKKSSNPKNRRMSKFFVPWLVSNHEYSPSASRSTKGSNKSIPCRSTSPKSTACKNKRSQSIPHDSPKLSMSCTRALFCSSEILDPEKSKESETENLNSNYLERKCSLSPVDPTLSSSSRDSSVSSTYLRSDQLQTSNIRKTKTSISSDSAGAVDVIVERVHRRPSIGDSDHSYILFQPIKEEEVPLYQFYERNIKERVSFCRSPSSLSPVMWSSLPESSCSPDNSVKLIKPQFSVVEQLSPDAKDMKMLWCELPEVKESGILERISAQELKLQEATFEFIQSQASYIRSLKVLFENFIKTPEFSGIESSTCVLSKHEHDVLFSDIIRVKEVSESLMGDLTRRWSDDILIPDVCDIIFRHATMPSFSVYVKYCSNRVYQERTLKELKETRLCFLEVLQKLESNPACQGLSLESFLFLPMQHIARLPLLLDNIFRWLVPDSPSYGVCKMALEAVHKVFMECNEGARKMERLEEMFVLNKQLEFKECKVIPLISASRWLLKKGEIMKLEFDKKTFGRSSRCVRVPVYIFLFNDLLVVTKRKSEDTYTVIDYCAREKVQAMAVNAKDLPHPIVVPNTCRYLIYLTLFNNHQGSAVDMILNCALL